MARLWSSGFELNSTATSMEWSEMAVSSIQTGTVRSGTYAFQISSLPSGSSKRARHQLFAAVNNGPLYVRTYINFATLPSAENRIIAISGSGTVDSTVMVYITVDNGGVLRLYDEDGQIGSDSSALSTGTWYRIEIKYDRTPSAGSQEVRARINGADFAIGTTQSLSSGVSQLYLGGNLHLEAQTTGSWFFDDVAVNTSTGSFQNNFPGPGNIIHLRPNAAGDANGFLAQVGGTVGSTNNFTRVNEVPPDDATSYNGSAAIDAEDLFNCDDSGLNASDIVNVVAVGVRMADLVSADATAAFKLEIEKTSAGTKSQSGTLIPNSTSWQTNTSAAPRLYSLTTYQDPDSAAWTQTTLDSMQIGYIQTVANVQTIAISNVWALVDYTLLADVTTTSTSLSTSSTSRSTSTSSTSSSTSISTSSTSSSISTSSTSSSISTSSTSRSTSTSSTSFSISTSSTSSSTSTSSTSTSRSTSTSSTSQSTSTSFSTSSTSISISTSSTSKSTSTSSTSSSTSLSTSSTSLSISTSSTSISVSTSSTSSSISTSSTSSSTSRSTSTSSTSSSTSQSTSTSSTSLSISTSSTSSSVSTSSTSSSISTSSTSVSFTTSTSSTSSSISTSSTSSSISTSISTSSTSVSVSTTTSISTSSTSTSLSTSSTSTSTTALSFDPQIYPHTIIKLRLR